MERAVLRGGLRDVSKSRSSLLRVTHRTFAASGKWHDAWILSARLSDVICLSLCQTVVFEHSLAWASIRRFPVAFHNVWTSYGGLGLGASRTS